MSATPAARCLSEAQQSIRSLLAAHLPRSVHRLTSTVPSVEYGTLGGTWPLPELPFSSIIQFDRSDISSISSPLDISSIKLISATFLPLFCLLEVLWDIPRDAALVQMLDRCTTPYGDTTFASSLGFHSTSNGPADPVASLHQPTLCVQSTASHSGSLPKVIMPARPEMDHRMK